MSLKNQLSLTGVLVFSTEQFSVGTTPFITGVSGGSFSSNSNGSVYIIHYTKC